MIEDDKDLLSGYLESVEAVGRDIASAKESSKKRVESAIRKLLAIGNSSHPILDSSNEAYDFLRHPDSSVRLAALFALTCHWPVDPEKAQPVFLELLLTDDDLEIRHMAISSVSSAFSGTDNVKVLRILDDMCEMWPEDSDLKTLVLLAKERIRTPNRTAPYESLNDATEAELIEQMREASAEWKNTLRNLRERKALLRSLLKGSDPQ